MTVKDIMQTSVLRVSEDTPIKEVARVIFSTGISGAPVVKGEKLVGIVTEEDILSHMYPTIQEIVEDYTHVRDFDWMEHNLLGLLDTPVKKIMNKKVISVTTNTPIMKAQAIMLSNKFSRVPIVDEREHLVGIVSQGDIFRQIIKDEMPQMEQERYAGFISKHYDVMIDWDQRFEYELPSLFRIFNRDRVRRVLDLGVWTGLYSIGIAKEGVEVVGLDHNPLMIAEANERKAQQSKKVQDNISFKLSNFEDVSKDVEGPFDAAICMGNSVLYLPGNTTNIFKNVAKTLREKDGIIIMQVLNVQKVLERKDRLLNFRIQPSHSPTEKEQLFLEFFDDQGKGIVNHNLMVFDSDGENWVYKGTTTIPIKYLKSGDIERSLKDAGFTDISFAGYNGDYQGEYGPMSFIKPFDEKFSDWMTVFARKK